MNQMPTWASTRDPLFILSFPAASLLNMTVQDLVTDAGCQAAAILEIRKQFPDQAALTGLMDLSLEAEAFGCPVQFAEDDLPVVTAPIVTNLTEAQALQIPDLNAGRLPVTLEALKQVRAASPDQPLLAGCIGPFSLAGRLADPSTALMMPVTDPEMLNLLLEKVSAFLIELLESYKAAGCDGVLMAEPMAGLMSPAMNRKFVLPWLQKIIRAVQDDDFSVVVHNCGPSASKCWKVLKQSGAAAYHFGNAVDIVSILESGPEVPVYGNLDPTKFVTESPEEIARMTRDLMETCGKSPQWRLSSGCDIPAAADLEGVRAAFDVWKEQEKN